MYEYCDKAQDFVDEWTARMGLPYLEVCLVNLDSKYSGIIHLQKSFLEINSAGIFNRAEFVRVILHELCHWWYYWRFKGDKYKQECRVIQLSYKLIKEYYPSYFKEAIDEAIRIVQMFNYASESPDYYYGYLDALKRYGIITDVRKVTAM